MAERYTIPSIQLTEEAKRLLTAYPWPGNIRQLKNVTEQITLLSPQREITGEILREYLPEVKSSLPMLASSKASQSGKTFESEREILYQVLFDMRQDMTELKRQVNALMNGKMPMAQPAAFPSRNNLPLADDTMASPTTISFHPQDGQDDFEYQDTEEYVEEPLSIEEAEKELIRKALIRHRGRRKAAAAELGFSERTLYRKIERYKLEDL